MHSPDSKYTVERKPQTPTSEKMLLTNNIPYGIIYRQIDRGALYDESSEAGIPFVPYIRQKAKAPKRYGKNGRNTAGLTREHPSDCHQSIGYGGVLSEFISVFYV